MAANETSIHVRKAKEGDADSVAWLVDRLSPLLLAQARYRVTDRLRRHVEPEDLVQEVWAVALPRLGELEARDGRETPVLLRFLSTTLLFSVNNLGRKVARREGREPPAPSSRPGLATMLAKSEAQQRVRDAIEELDPAHREILVLRGIEQHDVKDIALLLGLKPDAVRQRWSRALKRLRAQLPRSVFDDI